MSVAQLPVLRAPTRGDLGDAPTLGESALCVDDTQVRKISCGVGRATQGAMPIQAASPEEVGELLGHADSEIVQQVIETGASIDEIGAALDDLEEMRHGESRVPASPRVAQVRQIIKVLYAGGGSDNTIPIGGVLLPR